MSAFRFQYKSFPDFISHIVAYSIPCHTQHVVPSGNLRSLGFTKHYKTHCGTVTQHGDMDLNSQGVMYHDLENYIHKSLVNIPRANPGVT